LSEKTAKVFKDILKTVVEEGGTATQAAVEGNPAAGKTGTAQLIDPRQAGIPGTDLSVPLSVRSADNPRIALIVVVYEPKDRFTAGLLPALFSRTLPARRCRI